MIKLFGISFFLLVGYLIGQTVTLNGIPSQSMGATVTKITPVAVGSLPTCNEASAGTIAGVTDALLPVALATVSAGGAVKVPVYCNSAAWVVM